MGRFHVSSDSDYEPTEEEKALLRLTNKSKKKKKKKKDKEKGKEKVQQQHREKEKEKVTTKAEKYPLLSNYLRLYFPEEKLLEQYLCMIGEEDAAVFEDSWDKIYHSEFFITDQLELFRDKFHNLIIKHLNPTSSPPH